MSQRDGNVLFSVTGGWTCEALCVMFKIFLEAFTRFLVHFLELSSIWHNLNIELVLFNKQSGQVFTHNWFLILQSSEITTSRPDKTFGNVWNINLSSLPYWAIEVMDIYLDRIS